MDRDSLPSVPMDPEMSWADCRVGRGYHTVSGVKHKVGWFYQHLANGLTLAVERREISMAGYAMVVLADRRHFRRLVRSCVRKGYVHDKQSSELRGTDGEVLYTRAGRDTLPLCVGRNHGSSTVFTFSVSVP